MRLHRTLRLRLRSLFRRRDVDRDLDAELRDHLARQREIHLRAGLSPAEASAAAMRDFGSITLIQDRCRDARRLNAIDDSWRDLRYAIRSLRRAPGYALVAVVSIALAIGANASIFSLLNALVLRDLPVKDPGSLVQVSAATSLQGESPLTLPLFRTLSSRQQVFSGVIGTWGNPVVTVNDGTRVMKGSLWAATGNLFEELGLRPTLGRLLVAGDMTLDPLAAAPVAVLGHGFWQRHYRGDNAVLGRTISVEGSPFTVVGVAPPGFTGFSIVVEPDITIPLGAVPLVNARAGAALVGGQARSVQFVGRLKPSATVDQAQASLAVVWPGVREASVPPAYTGDRRDEFLSMGLKIATASNGFAAQLRSRYTQPLLILLAIASVVLLIACTNVAGLLWSRTSVRRHEIGLRLALGGSRWRVARQLMTEGVLLSVLGAAVGIVLSFWACATIAELVFAEYTIPVVFDGRPDVLVVVLTAMVAGAAGILCSALPAWRGTTGTAADALRADGRTSSVRGRTGQFLVGAQVALSLVLLTTAGVLVRTLAELRAVETGIERTDGVFVAYPEAAQPGAYDVVDNDTYYPEVLSRIEALPGIERASVSLLKPGTGGGFREAVARHGAPATAGVAATRSPVAPGFFDAIGVRIVRGRDLDWRDNSKSAKVTVLSEGLARRLFGTADPIGERVRIGLDPSRDGLEVIGVVADARVYNLRDDDVLAAYTAALQDPAASFKCFVMRGDGLSAADLRRAVEGLGRERVGNVVTLRHITDQSLLLERLTAMISSFFGSLVLLLAGIGVFGLLAQSVAERRKEIGIRIATGADSRRVVLEVVRKGLATTIAGLAVGIGAALFGVRIVDSLLFGVRPNDPVTLTTAATALVIVAAVASLVPAVRAARIDPVMALRGE